MEMGGSLAFVPVAVFYANSELGLSSLSKTVYRNEDQQHGIRSGAQKTTPASSLTVSLCYVFNGFGFAYIYIMRRGSVRILVT